MKNRYKLILGSGLASVVALSGAQQVTDGVVFGYEDINTVLTYDRQSQVHVNETASFVLDRSAAKALWLFTAPGEVLWAPNWQPIVLNGDGYQKGSVWLTKHGEDITYWQVAEFDQESFTAEYFLVSPTDFMGTVSVKISPEDSDNAKVSVSYQLTGLSSRGNKKLKYHYTGEAYQNMIREWREQIIDNREKISAFLKTKK